MKALLTCAIALCMISGPAQAAEPGQYSLWTEGWSLFGTKKEPVPPGMSLVRLVSLTSDRDQNVDYLNLMIDGNRKVTGMYSMPDPNNRDGSEGSGSNVFWLRDIESPRGAVMMRAQNRDVLIMQGRLDPQTQEGRFVIRYLSNGLFGRYGSCEFYLRRSGNGWMVQNAYTRARVTNGKVLTHSLGITTLQGICPAK
jgi:hypothetical protein